MTHSDLMPLRHETEFPDRDQKLTKMQRPTQLTAFSLNGTLASSREHSP